MLQNALETFSEHLFTSLIGCSVENANSARASLIKKHAVNLQLHGEFSFPSLIKCWHKHLNNEDDLSTVENITILEYMGKSLNYLVEESTNWNLRVRQATEGLGDRIYLYLDRPLAISVGLTQGLINNAKVTQLLEVQNTSVQIDPQSIEENSVTTLRVKYLSKAIENLCALSGSSPKIIVTSNTCCFSDDTVVFCGSVLNAKTKNLETTITPEELIRTRQNEMTLIAQHKYGVRVTTESKWKEFLSRIGESAVVFELLQRKHSSHVKIDFTTMTHGATKGLAFILYNCARIDTIIRSYDSQVDKGVYPPLPSFDDTDFSVLSLDDEWVLIFNFILGFPYMLQRCMDLELKTCVFRPHYICDYLCHMVKAFSQYYKRTKVLMEPRTHLIPVIHARIHLLKIFNGTLKSCLKILNISSVSQL